MNKQTDRQSGGQTNRANRANGTRAIASATDGLDEDQNQPRQGMDQVTNTGSKLRKEGDGCAWITVNIYHVANNKNA